MSNTNTDFLAEIYRGARMGAETLESIMPKVEDDELKSELLREKKRYSDFETKALKEITERHSEPEPINKMQKTMAEFGLKMNTAMDRSASHIADIVIQGNNMGVIGLTKTYNHHKGVEDSITHLAEELIDIQKDNIERLQPFL